MPSQYVSDINPQSLGVLQPIRPPQVSLSLPNPLGVAPFFQAQQLIQNNRRLDQADLSMALQEKQMDFERSKLLFQQTQEIIDHQNSIFERSYSGQKSASKGNAGMFGDYGIDTNYERGKAFQERLDAKQKQFLDSTTSKFNLAYPQSKRDPNSMNDLLVEMSMGKSRLQQEIMTDPEYRELANQHMKYKTFNDQIADLRTKGFDVNESKRQEIQAAYERLQNNITPYEGRLKDIGILNSAPEMINGVAYKGKDALATLQEAAKTIYAPEDLGVVNDNIPGAEGAVVAQKRRVTRSRDEALPILIGKAKSDPNIIKTFEAVSGSNPNDPDYETKLANWVAGVTDSYGVAKDMENILIDAAARIIQDPTKKQLADLKESSTGTSYGSARVNRFDDKTEEGRRLNDLTSRYSFEGFDLDKVSNDQLRTVDEIRNKFGRNSIVEEVDPKTGQKTIWQVRVDKETGERIPETDPKTGKESPYSKIGDPLMVLPIKVYEKDEKNSPKGSEVYQRGQVFTEKGAKLVPAFESGRLENFRNKVSKLRDLGETNVVVRASESPSSLAEDPDGAIGRYQFQGVHRTGFLNYIGDKTENTKDWTKAYEKLGKDEFARLEDQYYNEKIKNPAVEYLNSKLKENGINIEDSEGLKEFIGSSANQSSEKGWKKFFNKAVDALKQTKETIDSSTVLDVLYQERVKYISEVPEHKRGSYKENWGEIAVNRPFQDYVASQDIIDEEEDRPARQYEIKNDLSYGNQIVSMKENLNGNKGSDVTNIENTDPIKSKLLSGEKLSSDEINNKIKDITGKDIDYTEGSANMVKGNSLIGTLKTKIEVEKSSLDRYKDRYKIENKKREDKGEPLLGRIEDDPEFFKKSQEIQKLEKEIETEKEKNLQKGRSELIKHYFKDEVIQSANKLSEEIIDIILPNSTKSFDLEEISDFEGEIDESAVDPNELIIKRNGKVIERILKKDFPNWIEKNIVNAAINRYDPINFARENMKNKSKNVQPSSATSLEEKINRYK